MNRIATVAVVGMLTGGALSGCVGQPGTDAPGAQGAPLPQAVALASTVTPRAGEPVTFDVAKSLLNGATVASAAWRFGDGTTGSGLTLAHAFASPGRYVVTLGLTDALGRTVTNDASLLYVDVSPVGQRIEDIGVESPPVAVIAASGQTIASGTEVAFDGRASYGWMPNPKFKPARTIDGKNAPFVKNVSGIVEWSWAFGDGATATGATANHTYASPGLHASTLTVRAADGKTATAFHSVYVPTTRAAAVGGVKSPTVFTTATINGPVSLDPAYDYETAGGHVIQNVYETLVHYDRDNLKAMKAVLAREVPSVANGGISPDGLTYTFHLRRGVKFHDGTELDSAAVKYSIDRMVLMNDPGSPAWIYAGIRGAKAYSESDGTADDRAAYLAAVGVETVDKYVVRVHLDKPDAAFLPRMAFSAASIVSPAAFKAPHGERKAAWGVESTADGFPPSATADSPRATRDPWADRDAVGTGPFELRAWIPNDRTILDANAAYWDAAPKMRTIIVQYVDDDNSRVLMLLSGDADEAYVPKSLVDRVAGRDGVRVTELPSLSVTTILLGQDVKEADNCPRDRATGAADCQALADEHLRAAVTYVFDKQTYADAIAKGHAPLVPSVIPKGMFGQDSTIEPVMRDLAKAKDHLAKSRHPDGLTNFPLAAVKANTVSMETMELLKRNLAEIGIEATVLGLSFPELINGFHEQKFPAWLIGWNPDYAYPDNYVVPYLDGRVGEYAAGAGLEDETFHAMIDAAIAETDPAAAEAKWKEIDRKARDEFIHLWLSQQNNTHVERTWVGGYYYNAVDSGAPNFARYAHATKG